MELKSYVAQNAAGEILPGAEAYLYLPGTTTLAAGLTTAVGGAQANPVVADGNGLIQFRAPNGEYDLRVVVPGREYTLRIQCNDVTDTLASAEYAAARADAARVVAEDAAELAGLRRLFATYADAQQGIWDVPAGDIVRVLADETQGGAPTWYRSRAVEGATLVLDFVGQAYQVSEDPLQLITQPPGRLAAVPAASDAPGQLGQIALSDTHLYVAVATDTWRRVALQTF